MINVFDEMGINYYREWTERAKGRNIQLEKIHNEKKRTPNEWRKIYLIINIPINGVNELPKANAELKYWCVYESESEWVSERIE